VEFKRFKQELASHAKSGRGERDLDLCRLYCCVVIVIVVIVIIVVVVVVCFVLLCRPGVLYKFTHFFHRFIIQLFGLNLFGCFG